MVGGEEEWLLESPAVAMEIVISDGSWLSLLGSLEAEVTGMNVFSVYVEHWLTSIW